MVRRGYLLNPEPEHRLMYVGVTRAREKVIQLLGDGYML
jgi:ATP-dependent exoDNAse (exonuclease V) beta subunit